MIMSADHIEMSAGSLMLIHDPSTFAGGNPAALTAAAAELDVMAGAYAGVYAARAGITPDAAREIMRAETMLTAPAAVEAGFADSVSAHPVTMSVDADANRELARVAAGAAMSRAVEAQMKFEADAAAGLETGASQNPGQEAKTEKGISMTKANTNPPAAAAPAAAPVATPAAAPVMQALASAPVMSAAEAVVADKLKAERARVAGITENAALLPDHVSQADVAQMIADGTPLEDANKKMISMAAAGAPRTQRARVHITRDESETKVEGIIGALMHKANPHMHKMEGAATDYRGLKLSTLAMHLAGQDRGFTTPDSDVVRAGLRSTVLMSGAMGVSDFAYITTEVMNRTLRAAYDRRPSTWRSISRQRTANDFRVLHSVSAGGDFELKPVSENGEYLQSAITDEAQGLKLAKYGRQITLTFEAIVNDDMGVFERIPGDFARAAGTLEAKLAWGAIRDNAKLSDTKSLFHADHKNIGTASAINIASVGEGRKKMWEQRPAGSKDKDAFIQVSPDLLFVPPALEVAAMQFVAATTATKTSDVNPFGSTLTPAVEPSLGAVAGGSDTAWYLFASDMPVLEHAYLDGYEAPTVMTKEGMNPDGVNMVARHIFAATPVEYRGAIKNAGQ
jgi:hypothetical protein